MATGTTVSNHAMAKFRLFLPEYVEVTMQQPPYMLDRTILTFSLALYVHQKHTRRGLFRPNAIYCAIDISDQKLLRTTIKTYSEMTLLKMREYISRGKLQIPHYQPKTDDFRYEERQFNDWVIVYNGRSLGQPEALKPQHNPADKKSLRS